MKKTPAFMEKLPQKTQWASVMTREAALSIVSVLAAARIHQKDFLRLARGQAFVCERAITASRM